MSYPQIVEYNAAVQDPRHTFSDPELKAGRVAETPLGLPLALSGGFALTYTVQSGSKKFAVRCFHREVPQVQNRYAKISSKFRSLASSYFVNFEFQPQGIRVLRQQFPIVKMDWAEGETLGVYLDRAATNSTAVGALRQAEKRCKLTPHYIGASARADKQSSLRRMTSRTHLHQRFSASLKRCRHRARASKSYQPFVAHRSQPFQRWPSSKLDKKYPSLLVHLSRRQRKRLPLFISARSPW